MRGLVIYWIYDTMFVDMTIQKSSGSGNYGLIQNSTIQDTFRKTIQSSSTGYLIVIDKIGHFKFKSDMYFDKEAAGEGWIMLSNSNAKLYAIGRTIEEAKADLEETLNDIHEDYVLCDESELHISGIKLRTWFNENVEVLSE